MMRDWRASFVHGFAQGLAWLTCIWIASYLFPTLGERALDCVRAAAQ